MDKQAHLDQIAAEIINNNVCPDLAKQATQLVLGDGNPDARIVLIGEAPGKKEDQTGKPFVGASGKFLNQMLAHADLQRSDVYITNIVKYRPPNNRDPKVGEKQAFMPYLYAQLEVIQPVIVVTLGRHSMNCFLPDVQIGDVHGQVQKLRVEQRTWNILPLYHPAAALYNGGLRQTLLDDFSHIPTLIKKLTNVNLLKGN